MPPDRSTWPAAAANSTPRQRGPPLQVDGLRVTFKMEAGYKL